MYVVCIYGTDVVTIEEVCDTLTKMGFSEPHLYSTKNEEGYIHVDKVKFQELIDKDILLFWWEKDGHLYGQRKPIGERLVVYRLRDTNELKIARNIYDKQVYGVYVGEGDASLYDVKFEGGINYTLIVADILKNRNRYR
ncbi:MAG: hypothetical protein QXD03_05165 [Candidatus Anstonellales archaeon]